MKTRVKSGSRGQAAVELALVVPIIAMILLVVTDYARVFFMSIEVDNAARAGVAYGIASSANNTDLTGMQTAANNDGVDVPGLSSVASEYCVCSKHTKFTCGKSPACGDQATYVEVDTSATFHTLFNYPGIPHSIQLNGSAIMRAK